MLLFTFASNRFSIIKMDTFHECTNLQILHFDITMGRLGTYKNKVRIWSQSFTRRTNIPVFAIFKKSKFTITEKELPKQ